MHQRVREDNNITGDEIISVVSLANLQRDGNFPNDFYKFPIQIFLDINNDGLDILYLKEAPYEAVNNFNPEQMTRIDFAMRPMIGSIQKIGLIGRGSEMQVLIWPLAFYGDVPK